jgi:hypothetical protein
MAVTFLEPGGDATFNVADKTHGGLWSFVSGAAVATDFVHGGHINSIKYRPNLTDQVDTENTALADTGARLSVYIYLVALPNATSKIIGDDNNNVFSIRLTSAGVVQLFTDSIDAQLGGNGPTLSTGIWYRISLAYTVTSLTVNRFELFVNGVSAISVTNATLSHTNSKILYIANYQHNPTLDFRSSDHYADNSNSLTDPGDVWVTAKRPNANGTTNGFTTQIGAGGSGYGSGHSPQINERPTSTTNGWSITTAGSAITEEYNIEGKATGDINISNISTVVDYMGWVNTTALIAETGQIIVNGVASNISITTAGKVFTQMAGSTTYPAGTGTDIGIITSTTVTTVSLYECGIIVGYIPPPTGFASWASQTISNPLIGNDIQVV